MRKGKDNGGEEEDEGGELHGGEGERVVSVGSRPGGVVSLDEG